MAATEHPRPPLPTGVRAARVTVDGVEVAYHATAGNSPTVLYLHGNTGCNRWWDLCMDVPGHAVYAPDMPNFGRSGRLAESTIERYAESMASFVQTLGIAPVVPVGHSLGGAVAMALAARYPELVSALVLVNSAAPSGLHTPVERYPLIERFRTDRDLTRRALRAVVPTLRDEARLELLVDNAMLMNPDSFVGHAKALSSFAITAELTAVHIPALVVWGDQDVIITRAMAEETAAAFGNPPAQLHVLAGVGHSPIVEAPAAFLALLQSFLTTLPAPRAAR